MISFTLCYLSLHCKCQCATSERWEVNMPWGFIDESVSVQKENVFSWQSTAFVIQNLLTVVMITHE